MQPLVFEPYYRPLIWGGRLLKRRLGKSLPAEGNFGESWELSAHPHHVSRVAEGPMRGMTLGDVWQQHRAEVVGSETCSAGGFPWLVKFLDCRDLLSVQVHPDDATARELLSDETGKTEAWVVVDTEPTGRIYAGLKPGTRPADLQRHLDAGTVAECLHSFAPYPGDCVLLPAGTVHAVGGGVLLAEVQQSSDATFRLFDWNRVDRDGRPRPLHRKAAMRSIDWSAGPVRPAAPRSFENLCAGAEGEMLVRCPYFCLDRYRIRTELPVPYAGRMSVWMLLDGQAELRSTKADYRRPFQPGQTVLIPASSGPLTWVASGATPATALAVTLPE